MRPLEARDEGPLLELGALVDARGRGAVGFHEVEAVADDELGAGRGGVVEQAVERALVGGKRRGGAPGVAMDVEAEARVHDVQDCAANRGCCCRRVIAP
jgi:hypothetical protein